MTWREDLRRVNFAGRNLVGASFRGVPFFVEIVELSTGRRLVVHEFPLRNTPFVEDLGQRARKFRVDGYLIGDDYLTQKTSLLDALEAEGPGELVLPYYDAKRAIGETTSVRETRADGGYVVVVIEFVETPAQAPTPTIEVDASSVVASKADAAVIATKAELAEKYDPTGLPAFALASAETALKNAAEALGAKLAPAITETQEAASFAGQIEIMTTQASSLVHQPADAINQFGAAIENLANTAKAAPGALKDALVQTYAADLGAPVTPTTTTRQRELDNQLAFTGALRRIVAIEAARLTPVVPYASIEEATTARDEVADLLEEQAAGAGDTAYPALVDLRSEVLRAVPGSTVFARVITVTRRVAIPSLLLSYQLYGSVDQEADVLARNRIRHPGFVAGDLKVLSDAG